MDGVTTRPSHFISSIFPYFYIFLLIFIFAFSKDSTRVSQVPCKLAESSPKPCFLNHAHFSFFFPLFYYWIIQEMDMIGSREAGSGWRFIILSFQWVMENIQPHPPFLCIKPQPTYGHISRIHHFFASNHHRLTAISAASTIKKRWIQQPNQNIKENPNPLANAHFVILRFTMKIRIFFDDIAPLSTQSFLFLQTEKNTVKGIGLQSNSPHPLKDPTKTQRTLQ